MQLAAEWQERFQTVWGPDGRYRLGSEGLRLVPFVMATIPPQEINDFGSGTGRAAAELVKNGYRVNCVDIALNAMEPEAISKIGHGLTFTHAPLWNLPVYFPKNEWGICLDVLMTVPAGKLERILEEIRGSVNNLIVEVYNWQDRRLGYDLTDTIMDQEEWAKKLSNYWRDVEIKEHPQTNARFLYVCRG